MLIRNKATQQSILEPQLSFLRKQAFEYMIALVVKWDLDNRAKENPNQYNLTQSIEELKYSNSIDKFNNKLTTSKLLLYPFFIATSNGHTESMFTFIDEFYAFTSGPISLNIRKIAKINDLKYFTLDINEWGKFGLQIKPTYLPYSIDSIIKNIEIDKIDNLGYSLIDFEVKKDNEEVYTILSSAIEKGLSQMNKTVSNLIDFDINGLHKYSNRYDAYFNKRNDIVPQLIKVEEVLADKSLPFYPSK